MSKDELYKALIAYMVYLFNNDYPIINTPKFSGRAIFRGNNNNTFAPSDGKFIVINFLYDQQWCYNNLPDVINLDEQTQTYINLTSTKFQIDFYGENATKNATTLKTLFSSNNANNFFTDNNFNCSTHNCDAPQNMTEDIGRELYLERAMLKLSLFSNNIATAPLSVYDDIVNNINFVQ